MIGHKSHTEVSVSVCSGTVIIVDFNIYTNSMVGHTTLASEPILELRRESNFSPK